MEVKIDQNVTVGGSRLTVLAGPCMAESLEVCMETGRFLKQVCEKLDVGYVFKASFDKANRSSENTERGPGRMAGLAMLQDVKNELHLPIVTDVHEVADVDDASQVADILQIPAFLCRQTDLLHAAGRSGRAVNVKKGQFMAPEDMKGVVGKLEDAGCRNIMLTERGASFGYHNLVVDMRGLQTMRSFGYPVVYDATHSVQLPGGLGNASGGQREFIPVLSRAAAAAGIDAVFMEVHPEPAKALSDGPNSLDFAGAEKVLDEVKAIHELVGKMQ